MLIVGGGAAGTLTAIHLLASTTDPIDLVLVDPAEVPGRGTAFSTEDSLHLLNVPASGMTALPDDPGHFVRWRALTTGTAEQPYEFVPRGVWGRYLSQTLRDELSAAGSRATLTHVRRRARAVDVTGAGVRLTLDDGETLAGDALVIGTGLPAPSVAWAPEAMQASDRFVADPWSPGVLDRVTAERCGDVLVVGTGLTMVDVASTVAAEACHDRLVHAISRSGRLPHRHAPEAVDPAVPDVTDWGHDLTSIVDRTREHLRDAEAATGDWRSGVDGLRHRVQDLWGRLSEDDRREFLRSHAGEWNRVRHRIPAPSAERIAELRRQGRLTIGAARVTETRALPRGLRVWLSDGTVRDVAWVVNATGPDSDVRRSGDPLVADLLRPRDGGALAVCATAGMGFRTRDGRLLDSRGHAPAPIWVLGALRRGELWESTAVPEIRVQAAAIAREVASGATALSRSAV